MSKRYQQEVHEFIKANVEGKTTKELVKLVNSKYGTEFTESKMKSYKTNHKLKSGTPCGMQAGKATTIYPESVKNFIDANLQGTGPAKMAELLNSKFGTQYTNGQIKSFYGNHKLNCGLTGRFEKGHVPSNKGQKGFYPLGIEKGWFNKGHTPQNKMPIGTEMFKADGYIWVKTGEDSREWKQKHIFEWESVNGAVPEGCVLTFLDGDKSNTALDNIALITMAESLELNRSKLRSRNSEFTKTGILIVKVKAIGKKRKKKGRSHEIYHKRS